MYSIIQLHDCQYVNGRSHCLNVTLWSDWLVLFNLIGCYECHSSIWLVVTLYTVFLRTSIIQIHDVSILSEGHTVWLFLWSDWLVWMSLFDLIGWYECHSLIWLVGMDTTLGTKKIDTRNVLNFTSGYRVCWMSLRQNCTVFLHE